MTDSRLSLRCAAVRSLRVLLTTLATVAMATASPAEAQFQTGFSESSLPYLEPADQTAAVDHMAGAGAAFVRVGVIWADIAPRRPAAGQARRANWVGYDWRRIDSAVRAARAGGVLPVLTVERAPPWAEGPGKPADGALGNWKPSAAALGDFAAAMAARYSGSFAPAGAAPLPAVRYFQAWNEPNFPNYIKPQFGTGERRAVSVAAARYRRMLNAFYDAVKGVSRSNKVLAAATAPFGDYDRTPERTAPARFIRDLLCVSGRAKLVARRCRDGGPRFDVLATNPFSLGTPGSHYRNPDDVGIADIARIRRPLRAAERAGTLPGGRKAIWATEFGWDTNPPNPGPDGLAPVKQASYLQESLYRLWRSGVSVALWWRLRDAAAGKGFRDVSGVYLRGDSVAADLPKPSLTAFRFPFVAKRRGGGTELWGLRPGGAGRVTIERATGERWRRLATVRTRSGRVFSIKRGLPRKTRLRARAGTATSLVATVR